MPRQKMLLPIDSTPEELATLILNSKKLDYQEDSVYETSTDAPLDLDSNEV